MKNKSGHPWAEYDFSRPAQKNPGTWLPCDSEHQRAWSDFLDVHAELLLCCLHRGYIGFVMWWLIYIVS